MFVNRKVKKCFNKANLEKAVLFIYNGYDLQLFDVDIAIAS